MFYPGRIVMWFSRPLSSLASLAALLGSFSVGGCAYQLNSLAAKSATDVGSKHDAKPPEVDLAYARAVAAAALARDDKDDSTTWHNPNTGAGGYITPLASSYTEGTFTCRDFLASYVHGQTEAWLQGEACRTDHGKWEVKSLGVKRSHDPS
jgi:surface antigen